MPTIEQSAATIDITGLLDQVATADPVLSNTMFQLALMVARIAVEPGSEAYKDEAAQTLMGLIRAKPKSNVVRLFANRPKGETAAPGLRVAG